MSTHRDMARERMVVGTCSVGALECWRAYVSSIRHISWSTSLSIRPTEPLFEQNSGQLRYQNSCSPSTPARPLGRTRRGAGVVLFTQDISSQGSSVARLRTSILPHRYVLSSDYTLSHPGYFASNLRYSATTKFRSRNRHTGRGQPATRLDGTRLTHGRRRRTRYTITSSFGLFAAATRRCESLGGNSGGGGFAGSGTLTRESTRGIDAAADRWAPLPRP